MQPKVKKSLQARPKRRASQTFLIKYQLARNPLKAVEEDLKLALQASLEHSKANGIVLDQDSISASALSTPPPPQSSSKSANNKTTTQQQRTASNKRTTSKTRTTNQSSNNKVPVSKKHAQNNAKYATGNHQYFNNTNYQTYIPIQKREPPDEEYLKKYRPATQDFLHYICNRTTPTTLSNPTTNGSAHDNNNNSNNIIDNNNITGNNNNNNNNINSGNDINIDTNIIINCSSHNNDSTSRRPIRQSPRLRTRHKLSSTDNGKDKETIAGLANDNNYEENLEIASNALDLMAMETSLGSKANQNHNSRDTISRSSSSVSTNLKNSNRPYVKSLMTKEFPVGFAKIHDCRTNKS